MHTLSFENPQSGAPGDCDETPEASPLTAAVRRHDLALNSERRVGSLHSK